VLALSCDELDVIEKEDGGSERGREGEREERFIAQGREDAKDEKQMQEIEAGQMGQDPD
jgi:hypothetical protein